MLLNAGKRPASPLDGISGLFAEALSDDATREVISDESTAPVSQEKRSLSVHQQRLFLQKFEQTAKLAEIGLSFSELIHDLRQPLSGIFGFAQLIADKPGHPETAAWAGEIVQQSLRMQQMFERMRLFLRASEEIHAEWLDPRLALDEALAIFPRTRPGLSLCVEVPPTLPCVRADRASLVQVFWNLLANARDAVELDLEGAELQSGRIEIRSAQDASGALSLTFLDQGRGIPPEVASRLFEPFVTSKGERGTGLGLYICKKLLSRFDARLEVVPAPPPFATALSIRFPAP